MLSNTVLVELTALFSIVLFAFFKRFSSLPLPPGPIKLPIIGNLLSIPSNDAHKTFDKWAKKYNSGIIHLDVLGASIVVLNSLEVAKDLIEGRPDLYSSRPPLKFLNEFMNLHWLMVIFPFGNKWRISQKIFNRGFRPSAALGFQPVQKDAVVAYLRRLRDNPQPKNVMAELRHMIGATILTIAYGIKIDSTDDPLIALAEAANHSVSQAAVLPITSLMDIFPVLKYVPKWFPGGSFKHKAEYWSSLADDMYEIPYAAAQRAMKDNTATPSFISASLNEENDGTGLDRPAKEIVVKSMAATMYSGGVDATLCVMGTFLYKMLAHPEVQKNAHAEIDAVLKQKRLPDFTDQASMPYVTAIVREVLRMAPPAPTAFPHYIETDDIYQGYRIPAKSTVLMNVWAILHNEAIFPDPFTFNPQRFITGGKLNNKILNPENVIFGLGRRMCPGRQLTLWTQWLTIASTLSIYNIRAPIDKDGKEVQPDFAYIPGLLQLPTAFSCLFVPRFEGAGQLLDSRL